MGHQRRIEAGRGPRSLAGLIDDALVHLRNLGHTDDSRRRYEWVWKQFLDFIGESCCAQSALAGPSVARFLASRGILSRAEPHELSWSQKEVRRGMRILRDFHEKGWYRRSEPKIEPPHLPRGLQREHEANNTFCVGHLKLRPSTILQRRRVLGRFLGIVTSRGEDQPRGIDSACLSAFVSQRSRTLQRAALSSEVGIVRGFLRYLCMRGQLRADLVEQLPSIRGIREHRLPSIWPMEAVNAVLGAMDRSTPTGKRDYAIVLLACRLGLRSSDIRALRLDDIHWEQGLIRIVQSKTGRPLTLPLDSKVGAAIIEYLRHGRPATRHREVFLKVKAPIEPLARTTNSLHGILTSALDRAKVTLPPGTRRGLHSLRHNAARRIMPLRSSLCLS